MATRPTCRDEESQESDRIIENAVLDSSAEAVGEVVDVLLASWSKVGDSGDQSGSSWPMK